MLEIADKWLKEHGAEEADIQKVLGCIKATSTKLQPDGLLQEVLKDADTLNIGTDLYKLRSDLLRLENVFISNEVVDENEWLQEELNFLKSINIILLTRR